MKRSSRVMFVCLLISAIVFSPLFSTEIVKATQPIEPIESTQQIELTHDGLQSLLKKYFATYWGVSETSDLKPLIDFVNQYWSDPQGENAQRIITVASLIREAGLIGKSSKEDINSTVTIDELSDNGDQFRTKATVITSYFSNNGGRRSPIPSGSADKVELSINRKTGKIDHLSFESDFDHQFASGMTADDIIQRMKDNRAESDRQNADPLKYGYGDHLTVNGKALFSQEKEPMSPQAQTYNRTNAKWWAHTYYATVAPGYVDYYSDNGDCTNFVSQCLRYGGAPDDSTGPVAHTWFYGLYGGGALGTNPAIHRTSSWTGVKELYAYLTANTSSGPGSYATTAQYPMDYYYCSSLAIGDVIQFHNGGDWGHSALVTGIVKEWAIDNPGQIYDEYYYYVTYHSTGGSSNRIDREVYDMRTSYSHWRPLPIFIR